MAFELDRALGNAFAYQQGPVFFAIAKAGYQDPGGRALLVEFEGSGRAKKDFAAENDDGVGFDWCAGALVLDAKEIWGEVEGAERGHRTEEEKGGGGKEEARAFKFQRKILPQRTRTSNFQLRASNFELKHGEKSRKWGFDRG